jgi:hypothetical protein
MSRRTSTIYSFYLYVDSLCQNEYIKFLPLSFHRIFTVISSYSFWDHSFFFDIMHVMLDGVTQPNMPKSKQRTNMWPNIRSQAVFETAMLICELPKNCVLSFLCFTEENIPACEISNIWWSKRLLFSFMENVIAACQIYTIKNWSSLRIWNKRRADMKKKKENVWITSLWCNRLSAMHAEKAWSSNPSSYVSDQMRAVREARPKRKY